LEAPFADNESTLDAKAVGAVRQILKFVGVQKISRIFELDDTAEELFKVFPNCNFFHRGGKTIPRPVIIPTTSPIAMLPFNVILPGSDVVTTFHCRHDSMVSALLNAVLSGTGGRFAVQLLHNGGSMDPERTSLSIDEPRDARIVELVTVTVALPSGEVRSLTVTDFQSVADMMAIVEGEVANAAGRILEPECTITQARRMNGNAFRVIEMNNIVKLGMEGTSLRMRFEADAPISAFREALAENMKVTPFRIVLRDNRGPILENIPVRNVDGLVTISIRKVVMKPVTDEHDLRSQMNVTGMGRRECSQCFSFHDYNYPAALGDLQRP
jgi:hypothetical protein